jgi:hypothetical protein
MGHIMGEGKRKATENIPRFCDFAMQNIFYLFPITYRNLIRKCYAL